MLRTHCRYSVAAYELKRPGLLTVGARGDKACMDPKLLEYFVRVAEIKSMNRAALVLNISQPQLSRYIAALEHEAGTELFVRGQRGVTLTMSGQLLAERVKPILQQINALQEELGRATTELAVLGMPAVLREVVTGPVIAALVKAHPQLQLRVYEGLSNAIKGWLHNGLVDVGMVAFEAELTPPFVQTPLVREPLLLIGDADCGLSADSPVKLDELGEFKFVLAGKPNLLRHIVEAGMRRRGIAFKSVVEAESSSLALELVRQGLGCTVLPLSAIHLSPLLSSYRWAPVSGLSITWALTVNEGRKSSQGVRHVCEGFQDFVRNLVVRGDWPGAELVGSDSGR